MDRIGQIFKILERATLMITMVAALLTIHLYWLEAESRANSHRATIVSTYITCQDLLEFSLNQEEELIHRLSLSTVELEDIAPLCRDVEGDLRDLMTASRERTVLSAEEAREALKRAVPSGGGPDF